MTFSIEEAPFLDLILLNPLNPISVKKFKVWPINLSHNLDIVAFLTEAWKSTESEITTKSQFLPIFEGIKGD